MKRKIADVRKEICQLDSELTHEIIVNAAKGIYVLTDEQLALASRLLELKMRYPNWERNQKPIKE